MPCKQSWGRINATRNCCASLSTSLLPAMLQVCLQHYCKSGYQSGYQPALLRSHKYVEKLRRLFCTWFFVVLCWFAEGKEAGGHSNDAVKKTDNQSIISAVNQSIRLTINQSISINQLTSRLASRLHQIVYGDHIIDWRQEIAIAHYQAG